MGTNPTIHKATILALVVLPLLATLGAVILLWERYVFWSDIALLLAFYAISAMGVTIGFHRMLTHDGFKAPAWLRGLILICGSMAFEGAPDMWTATHVKHHAHSDDDDDPHSPLHGFWHAHMGWLLNRGSFAPVGQYAPHLLEDPVVRFVSRYILVWMGLSLLIPFLLGGWTGLIWGGGVRIFLTTHVTWSVNSVCHTFGRRPFQTTDESRNEWVVGLLAFGEGWHNNHHAFPRNAFHGMRWWQFDLSGVVIRFLELAGLAWDVERVSPQAVEAHRRHAELSTAKVAEMRDQLAASIAAAKQELWTMMQASLTPMQKSRLEAMRVELESRLNDMQATLAKAQNLKRRKLAAYRAEIQRMLEEAKAASRELAAA